MGQEDGSEDFHEASRRALIAVSLAVFFFFLTANQLFFLLVPECF